jgi:phage anti-repressor protein
MLDKYESVALSLQKLKSNLFFKACANFNPKNKLYQNTLWETLLDTDLYKNPTLVKNHLTNEKELVCVDAKNNLYLLSNTGKILWKRNINEKILGEIHQVDYFDNDKLQLLFNTENYLYMIDRNGKNVSGFPVKLNTPASNGLTLFDYESNKNYRLWVPLKNNTSICYAINGKKLVDFIPVNNTGEIRRIVLQQKDYFILIDSSGKIDVVNRKGETRLKIKSKIVESVQASYIEEGKNAETTNICYLDKAAKKLIKLSLEDKLQEVPIPEENDIQFAFIDTLQNSIAPQLVCVTEKGIEVFDFFGKKLYDLSLDIKIHPQISPLLFKEKHIYAALEKGTNKLFLLDVVGNKITDTEIKLDKLPDNYNLINNEKQYLLGYYENKVLCIKQ